MKIDIICNDGSPLGVCTRDIYGENGRIGVGGAELALLTLCEAWHDAGHEIRLYNSPTITNGSPFPQFGIDFFIPKEYRDILIIFRSPNHRINGAVGKKIWFSTDQYTVGDFSVFAPLVDEIVTISPFHQRHFKNVYNIEKTHVIDLPVRVDDYKNIVEKIPNRLIFCSVPDRGLEILAECYGAIREGIPDVSLTITSDYRLWGVQDARNEQYIRKFLGTGGVRFLGAIPRREMVLEQQLAQIQAYPCIYDELFCYSVAECEVAGALPITSGIGAMETTNMGVIIYGNPQDRLWKDAFIDMIVRHLKDPNLKQKQLEVQQKAIERFSLEKIMKKWDEVFENV